MATPTEPGAALAPARSSAQALNQRCRCRTLNEPLLRAQMGGTLSPQLFSANVVFLANEVVQQIVQLVTAIERVAALPAYKTQALAHAPAIAHQAFGPLGACMGYDFHLGAEGPKLIEINTNAGGALLNVALARAQQSCCAEMDAALPPNARDDDLEATVFVMFAAEWRRQRGDAPWRTALIVDEAPAAQYLAPEFELFRQLFERYGVAAHIADPLELAWHDGKLWYQGMVVDLVYNRLTDFYLDEPDHRALRQAYEAGAVVLTPHPHAHALYSDKRNLIALSHDALLAGWGVSPPDRGLLQAGVPPTELVTPACADELWSRRRQLFFKPVASFGAKAAYRGDKLTRRVWAEILAGDFVAQVLVPPGERFIEVDGVSSELKFDIRAYTYAGNIQLLAARLYAGQTTNFRTPGGGFAPVIVV
jgi:hypothetical protein